MKESTVKTTHQQADTPLVSVAPTDLSEHALSVPDESLVVTEYRLRLASLMMIKQLMHLCQDTQKHRGLGMGLLAGNKEFAARFARLQQQMDRRINTLYVFCQIADNPFNEADANKIHEAWSTIREGWYDDSVLENFQFHSYFIEQLLQMVMPLSTCLQSVSDRHTSPHILYTASAEDKVALEAQDQLLAFICYQLPKMIEFLGMVRALASHSASVGSHIEEHDKKLKYLCQCVQREKHQVTNTAKSLYEMVGNQIPSLLVLQTYAFKVDAFIERVMRDIIGKTQITWSSDDLFTMATEVMDVHWRVVDDGINVIQQWQDTALEAWYLNG